VSGLEYCTLGADAIAKALPCNIQDLTPFPKT